MFFGVFPVFVYADDGEFTTGTISVNFSNGDVSFPYIFRLFDDWINNPDYYSNFTSVMQQLGCSYCLNSTVSTRLSSDMFYDDFSMPISISHSGNWQDLSFSCPINFYFVYGSGSEYSYVSLTPFFRGTATITFSDGTTESINLLSSTSISFSAKKDNRTNMFNLTSDNAFNLTSKDTASLVGSLSHSDGDINAPVSGQVSGTAQLPDELKADIHAGGTASFSTRGYNGIIKSLYTPSGGQHFQTDNQLEIQQNATGMPIGVRYFNIFASKLAISIQNGTFNADNASIYFGASQAISLTASLVNAKVDSLTVTGAKASVVGTLVAPNSSVDSVVQISRHEPFVTVTNFSISGSFYFPVTVLIPSGSIDFLNDNNFGAFFVFNTLYTYGISENLLARIASATEGIYYTLRYDIPLAIRHLLIPTQEEVKDVLEESFDNIAEEYPGAAGTINTIKNQFSDFNASISGSSTRGLVLPGITVSVPGGEKVKLWEDFDLLPYLQTGPARSLMYWVELMLKALIFIYLVRQAASMFISAVTGYSYIEWFGLSNKPFMGDDTPGEALPDGYLDREVG